jgi:hopanoid biosynthesis associated RND transporter like protein HpnN
MRDIFLGRIARFAASRPVLMFVVMLVVTAVAAGLASRLTLKTHAKDLMPQKHPMVREFDRIIDDYSTASMIIVAARGEESQLKRFADELVPKIEGMTDYIQRVDYKLEREFFLEHGFLLQKAKDLKNSGDIFRDLSFLPWLMHLNDNFEKTYVYDSESISTKEKENSAVAFLDGIKYWLSAVEQYAVKGYDVDTGLARRTVERFLLGDEYFISQDKDMLIIFAQPTFTVMDIRQCIDASNAVDGLIERVSRKYPGILAGTTGSIALQRDENNAISQDMYLTSVIALILIIILFIASFRMWVAPVLAGITLIIGIIWTAGFSALAVGSLNLMTSAFAVILVGLGVDFSIHIISVYTENRAAGCPIGESLHNALLKSGKGIITGGLTTACAFLTLLVSQTAGMREFGIVAGSGVVFCMLASIVVLPAMLSLRDKILIKIRKEKYSVKSTDFSFLGDIATVISKRRVWILTGSFLVTILLLYSAINITFDYNLLNLEPVGLTSIELQHEMEHEFDITPDFAMITAESIEDARRIADEAKELKMIGMVTSISEYIPSRDEQQKRLPIIREIRSDLENNREITPLSVDNMDDFINELHRLEDNIIELAQLAYLGGQDKVDKKCKELVGDLEAADRKSMIMALVEVLKFREERGLEILNLFHTQFEPHFREVALGMASATPISLDDLPRNITDRFVNKDGNKYLVTIYPKDQIWDLEFLKRFTEQMQRLDPRVTGAPSIFYILMQIIADDGRIAALLTLTIVFLLLLWDFRKLHYAVMAMVPLVVGAVWMVGIMQLFNLKLTLMNVIGLPLILGIGIDDGVHILHRYRAEGRGKIRTVFTSTGKAVLLTSITTMLAFGSLVFATYRGLGSLGIALFIGVGSCFLTSIIILPALLGWLEKEKSGKTVPAKDKREIKV